MTHPANHVGLFIINIQQLRDRKQALAMMYSKGVEQHINLQHYFWEACCKINGVF